MAKVHVSGPAGLYVSIGQTFPVNPAFYPAKSQIRYLGTCEGGVDIQFLPRIKPVYADYAGGEDAAPVDLIDLGADAITTGVLNKWNELVHEQLLSRPNANDTPGLDAGPSASSPLYRGSLMLAQGYMYHLWIRTPYFGVKGVYSALAGGWHFPASMMIGPDLLKSGTLANKRQVIIKSIPFYQSSVGSPNSARSFTLYDNVMTSIPTQPPSGDAGTIP